MLQPKAHLHVQVAAERLLLCIAHPWKDEKKMKSNQTDAHESKNNNVCKIGLRPSPWGFAAAAATAAYYCHDYDHGLYQDVPRNEHG